jgi:prevent-host-death family protein
MSEEIVPVTKFKTACLALLDKVNSTGQPILVTRQGKPIALISPPHGPKRPSLG